MWFLKRENSVKTFRVKYVLRQKKCRDNCRSGKGGENDKADHNWNSPIAWWWQIKVVKMLEKRCKCHLLYVMQRKSDIEMVWMHSSWIRTMADCILLVRNLYIIYIRMVWDFQMICQFIVRRSGCDYPSLEFKTK